jgi:DNA-binding CsgD family transcriptional regulator
LSVSQRLRIWEVRAVGDLLGQIAELGRNPTAWRMRALEGLHDLTGGSVAMTLDMANAQPGMQPQPIDPLDIGWDEQTRQIYFSYYTSNVVVEDPGAEALFANHQRTHFLTMTRRQMVDDQRWYASPAVSEYRKSGNVDDFVCSSVSWPVGWLQGFIVYRPWGGSRFDRRQRRIMRLFHLGLMRLYRSSRRENPQNDVIADLPPRAAQTLDLLLLGDTPKDIAAKLYISAHTVNDYTKMIYRRLGVATRSQLLTRFLAPSELHKLVLPRGMPAPPWPGKK